MPVFAQWCLGLGFVDCVGVVSTLSRVILLLTFPCVLIFCLLRGLWRGLQRKCKTLCVTVLCSSLTSWGFQDGPREYVFCFCVCVCVLMFLLYLYLLSFFQSLSVSRSIYLSFYLSNQELPTYLSIYLSV